MSRIARRFVHLLWCNFHAKWMNHTVGDLFLRTSARLPDKTMLVLCQDVPDLSMTYRECREMSCRIARYFQSQGYKKVDILIKL